MELLLTVVVCYRWMQLGKPMPSPVEAPASEETKPVVVSNPTPVEAAA
jgi:hypothetical protein